ncbi:MAG: galactokinase family protein [Kiritimatiellae bacterium]|nr:galactokinase family protein [Kiritimatiellia bacterium]
MRPAFSISTDFHDAFGCEPEGVYAASGRMELAGNHTDHQGGEVLAATVHLSIRAAVRRRMDRIVRVRSAGYPDVEISLDQSDPIPTEAGTPSALVRGTAAQWLGMGYPAGGWEALVSSDIPPGSGLSSSAAFAVLMLSIFNGLYSGNQVTALALARMAREAEVHYFGKPCGLMDQLAVSAGGFSHISFRDPNQPERESCFMDFSRHGLAFAVLNTGGSHAGLIEEYATIAQEMGAVAQFLGGSKLADVEESGIRRRSREIRLRFGDRAWLRCAHFYEENRTVRAMVKAMKTNRPDLFLQGMRSSGCSSVLCLQNIHPAGVFREQPLRVALAATDHFLQGEGACRVHGGGFAGTILACLRADRLGAYAEAMKPIFGTDAVLPLEVTGRGAGRIG